MNKEQAKVLHEQQKLQKMVDEFKKMNDTDPGVDEKWNAIDKQTGALNDARSRLDIRSQPYYLGINEKHNVRGKYTANNIKNMSNGQLNSFYNNSYKESQFLSSGFKQPFCICHSYLSKLLLNNGLATIEVLTFGLNFCSFCCSG